ncbi:GPW/gp25 family protein [Nostoc sp. CHAB 5784]|uniref:GPW/gp25 family protein n=1 Tax=Nostoc mirabile TaxID=2907820 RepID=UPI001E4D2541|nr:GPW/gp25 family protein [Nostoc mirabile]MCC5667897.1 GPW/gp25 family protein [Nostoc mirabile CHAB5784]
MPEYLLNLPRQRNVINIDFPFNFDRYHRTASTSDEDSHIRDLIEQLLFTTPGERVNRPDFGSGVLSLIFAPNSAELATAMEITIQASIEQWLGDLIDLQTLEVTSVDADLYIVVEYVVQSSGEAQTATFRTTVP